jgi:hypothetical protein
VIGTTRGSGRAGYIRQQVVVLQQVPTQAPFWQVGEPPSVQQLQGVPLGASNVCALQVLPLPSQCP